MCYFYASYDSFRFKCKTRGGIIIVINYASDENKSTHQNDRLPSHPANWYQKMTLHLKVVPSIDRIVAAKITDLQVESLPNQTIPEIVQGKLK